MQEKCMSIWIIDTQLYSVSGTPYSFLNCSTSSSKHGRICKHMAQVWRRLLHLDFDWAEFPRPPLQQLCWEFYRAFARRQLIELDVPQHHHDDTQRIEDHGSICRDCCFGTQRSQIALTALASRANEIGPFTLVSPCNSTYDSKSTVASTSLCSRTTFRPSGPCRYPILRTGRSGT